MNNYCNLYDLVSLLGNETLSEKYVETLIKNKTFKYRHLEILCIEKLLSKLRVSRNCVENFLYSYSIPQLNKEFDLLTFFEDSVLNIELKYKKVYDEKILKQLSQNFHYLKFIRQKVNLFTYIFETNQLYMFTTNSIVEVSIDYLKTFIETKKARIELDVDSLFKPTKFLISPLNNSEGFINKEYLLTENQENIKNKVREFVRKSDDRFFALKGGAGTGKTLLAFDIARDLSLDFKILFVHCGILCFGHQKLNNSLNNVKIISAKELRLREIKDVDVVIVDETHRLYESLLDKIERWSQKGNAKCLFTYDSKQVLSKLETERNIPLKIEKICENNIAELTKTIRTNKELSIFISCLNDFSKYRPNEYTFDNVKIFYRKDLSDAFSLADYLEQEFDYKYISFTPSTIYKTKLTSHRNLRNTHTVIGQEFDNVCMIIDNTFFFNENKLCAKEHPNPDYLTNY